MNMGAPSPVNGGGSTAMVSAMPFAVVLSQSAALLAGTRRQGAQLDLKQATTFPAKYGGSHDGYGQEDHRPHAERSGEFSAVSKRAE